MKCLFKMRDDNNFPFLRGGIMHASQVWEWHGIKMTITAKRWLLSRVLRNILEAIDGYGGLVDD